MSGQIIGPIGVLPTAVSVLAIDGTPVHVNASTTTVTTGTLTATQTNDYIIVCVVSNATTDLVSVKSGSGTSFSVVATYPGSANNWLDIYALFSAGVFNDTIVVIQGSANFCTVDAFAVKGSGQTSLVFDAGGPQNAATDPVAITTASNNTMVIATFREGVSASPTAGSGFTAISGADFMLTEYKLVPTATTTSCTQTTGAGTATECLAIAIVHV